MQAAPAGGPKTGKDRLFWRVWKALGALVAIGIVSIAVLLTLMWREHKTAFSLPTPTGSFAVGRATFAWRDKAETQVLVWMWYPAAPSTPDKPAEYLPAAWRAAVAKQQGRLMSTLFKRDPAMVRTHSFANAPVASEQPSYPVVLLRAGGSALTTDFTTLAEDLASHGYFVVGFDAPHVTFVTVLPDGTVIPRSPQNNVENAGDDLNDPLVGRLLGVWTSDAKFVVDRLSALNADKSSAFAGRMDLSRLGFVGHSFGGATALEFCHEAARCKSAVDLDGIPFGSVLKDGLAKPCMFVLSDHRGEMSDPTTGQVQKEIESIYDRDSEGRAYVVIRNANHFSFSDQILLDSQIAIGMIRHVVKFGGLDGRRGLAIANDCVRTFFDEYLKGATGASLQQVARQYPEVQLRSDQPQAAQ